MNNKFLSYFVINHLIYYPTPKNINYLWSFGSLAGISFVIQLLTGIFLAMHYIPNVEFAFDSVEHIMRDVSYGWLIRYLHANGASLVFIFLYLHIARGLYFRSYSASRSLLWISGVVIFLCMMGTAFVGYVLPWGQMSYWGATVITNLITAIPYIGNSVAYWIWGGYSVGNPTLNRFLSFHSLLPFIIIGLICLHLSLLHYIGSTNPIGSISSKDLVIFWPYSGIKDLFILILSLLNYCFILYFMPNLLGHPDNYIQANPLVTPAHIVPEWYFLPFYAILRAVPDKLGGVIAMLAAIIILLLLPLISGVIKIKSTKFNPIRRSIFWAFICIFIFLGFIGGNVAEEPFIFYGRIASLAYFILLFMLETSNVYFLTKRIFFKNLNTKILLKKKWH